ncbi:MAG TPA: hypothetical protein PK677_05385 [Acidiphilium sp.]|nr:MAG: hypothetical protein B7Z67_05300 [Acidiphilium sp. 21-60-14]OYV92539.1 MAG: hypothetical protein B7Z57_00465 [Acidiphilium sp. 37-60-79]OZB40990.1 MAG: hypothetical protein B7X48_02790 [Acidiphilium sp. 34-60-192]HQT87971.1 hypothetical protein [Acidiphilium sp.]HQU22743.1 hypothetical protein [Acidiphilium sp.]
MSTGASLPFRPAGTVVIGASAAAASIALPPGGSSMLVYNSTTSVAFIRFGMVGDTTAQISDTPVPPGARMLFDAGRLVTTASVVLASGTGSVFFTRGDGSVY